MSFGVRGQSSKEGAAGGLCPGSLGWDEQGEGGALVGLR